MKVFESVNQNKSRMLTRFTRYVSFYDCKFSVPCCYALFFLYIRTSNFLLRLSWYYLFVILAKSQNVIKTSVTKIPYTFHKKNYFEQCGSKMPKNKNKLRAIPSMKLLSLKYKSMKLGFRPWNTQNLSWK